MAESTERYIAPISGVELRDNGNKLRTICGYAAVYNEWSDDLGGFREVIRPGAFDEALAEGQDVYARVQHEGGLSTVGRTSKGTLRLFSDEHGLRYEIDPPNTSAGRDLVELVERGDISNSSFAFSLRGNGAQKWHWNKTPVERELFNLNLHDIAPVTGPAYSATTCEARAQSVAAYEQARAGIEKPKPQTRFKGTTRVEMRAENGKKIAELYIMDEIVPPGFEGFFGGAGVSAVSILNELEKAKDADQIDVYINSPGGAAFEGVAIYNMLRKHAAPVNVYVQGLAASAASVIAMAGDFISMGLGSQMMIHRVWTIALGNSTELRKEANVLDGIDNEVAAIYASRTKHPLKQALAWMADETWFGAHAAVQAGLANEVSGGDADAIEEARSNDFKKLGFRNVPADWTVADEPASHTEAQELISDREQQRVRDLIARVTARKSA